MIDYDILDSFGTHQLRLEALFTAEKDNLTPAGEKVFKDEYEEQGDITKKQLAEKLYNARKRWETRIQDRLQNGRDMSMRHYKYYMAADLAWDSNPITPERFAHMLYANGDLKLDFQEMYTETVRSSGQTIADEMFVKDKKGQNVIGINTPKMTDMTINLVRPYIRRAVAAQVNRYENLHPFLRYESRSQGLVGKLQADILSERSEIMTDQFGYRHNIGQEIRGMFLHSHSVSFVENSWAVEKQIHRVHDESRPGGYRQKEVIEKEGIRFRKIHPTRVFYEAHHPLSSINYDNGCQFLGYWDIVQYKDVQGNNRFFNTDAIPYSNSLHTFQRKHSAFFGNYYASTIKNINERPTGAEKNSRESNAYAFYSDTIEDDCVWLTHYYEKITPKQEGMGSYPHPVWVHLIVAGDCTVVFAEVLPSRPAYCLHYDENDERLFNNSMALDILPYQDHISALQSQVMYLLQIQNLLVLALDSDVVSEEIRDQMKKVVEGRKIFDKVHLMEFSSQVEDLFDRPMSQKKPLQIFQANVSNVLGDLMNSIASLTRMLERNQMMSPNEMGQFVERETSATEVQQVSSTSSDLHSFKSSGIDEARHAMKVILYESLIACGSTKVKVSVPERYPNEVVKHLGFHVDTNGFYEHAGSGLNVIGTKHNLIGAYLFSSRDGAERTSNTESAKVLMELMRYILSSESTFKAFVESYGMEQVTKSMSEIFRLAGSPMTLKLPINFDEDNLMSQLGDDPAEVRKKLMDAVQQLNARVQQLEEVANDYVTSQEAAIGIDQPSAGTQPQPPQPPQAPPIPGGAMPSI